MTDDNAPVRKHLRAARGHLEGMSARRRAAQEVMALLANAAAQGAPQEPTAPPTEAPPP